jgi:hypothetical protein
MQICFRELINPNFKYALGGFTHQGFFVVFIVLVRQKIADRRVELEKLKGRDSEPSDLESVFGCGF